MKDHVSTRFWKVYPESVICFCHFFGIDRQCLTDSRNGNVSKILNFCEIDKFNNLWFNENEMIQALLPLIHKIPPLCYPAGRYMTVISNFFHIHHFITKIININIKSQESPPFKNL